MAWFTVRGIWVHGDDSGDQALYEERMLLLRAADSEQAVDQAEADARTYVALNPTFRRIGDWGVFVVNRSSDDLSGAEIWSTLAVSALTPEEFFLRRYTNFELQPDVELDP